MARKKPRITSRYGPRADPFHGRPTFHHGIDIGAPEGTPIRSGTRGVVVAVGSSKTAGRWLAVQRPGTEASPEFYVYAHLAARYVQRGDKVVRGTRLASVGKTGRATGPHLHFEVSTANGSRPAVACELPIVR